MSDDFNTFDEAFGAFWTTLTGALHIEQLLRAIMRGLTWLNWTAARALNWLLRLTPLDDR